MKGKSRKRIVRRDLMMIGESAKRRAAKYERQAYDKPVTHEGEGGKPKIENGKGSPLRQTPLFSAKPIS